MKKSLVLILVIVIVVIVIAGAVLGYLYYSGFFNNHQGRFPGGQGQKGKYNASRNYNGSINLHLNQSQIDNVTSFFNSNPSQQQINNYCMKSRINCIYYCRNISQNNDYCKQLNATRPGNYTGGPGGVPPQGMPPLPGQ